MSFLLTAFRTRMRYRLRDSETPYTLADALIDAWGNAALQDLTVLVPHISISSSLTFDPAASSFDMSLLTRFLFLRSVSLGGANGHPIPEHPSGIEYIRAKETGEGIISGDPTYCVVDNHTMLYFDAIIAGTLKLSYWQLPKTWVTVVADATTESLYPDGLLVTGFDDLILAMSCIKAGTDVGDDFGDELVKKHYPMVFGDHNNGIIGQLEKFESFVEKTSHKGDKLRIQYSDMGGDPHLYGTMGR